jgi:hypothetical protein
MERKYSMNQWFSLRHVEMMVTCLPLLFHQILAGYPQVFAQASEVKSAENQRDFHIFCTCFSYRFPRLFFRSFYDVFPKEIADAAEEKSGRGAGKVGTLRKRGC